MKIRLVDLTNMHPCLLWDDILAATVSVFEDRGFASPYGIAATWDDIPNYGSGQALLQVNSDHIPTNNVNKIRRTYEQQHLVEFAAIAIAAITLFHTGGRQIRDVALRGSSADYLVDEESYLLEIAGRSRKSDFRVAWDNRWQRLQERTETGFYLCVTEFETPAVRLAFANAGD